MFIRRFVAASEANPETCSSLSDDHSESLENEDHQGTNVSQRREHYVFLLT